MSQQSQVSQGLLSVEASPSHSDTPHSVELLWTNDQPDTETSTWQHTHTQTQNTHLRRTSLSPASFEPTIPASKRQQSHALDRANTGIGTYFR